MVFARCAQQSTCCWSGVNSQKSDELEKKRVHCALSTPSTDTCCGLCSRALAYNVICKPASVPRRHASSWAGGRMMVSTRNGVTSPGGSGKGMRYRQGYVLSPHIFNALAPLRYTPRLYASVRTRTLFVFGSPGRGWGRGNAEKLACQRKTVWGMLYVGDAGI